ncbi:hypothetical protein ACJMK2_005407, partial [Sinanodonta woodiana]
AKQVDYTMIASCARDVYEDLIGRFCRIGDSQFRKDTITRREIETRQFEKEGGHEIKAHTQ